MIEHFYRQAPGYDRPFLFRVPFNVGGSKVGAWKMTVRYRVGEWAKENQIEYSTCSESDGTFYHIFVTFHTFEDALAYQLRFG